MQDMYESRLKFTYAVAVAAGVKYDSLGWNMCESKLTFMCFSMSKNVRARPHDLQIRRHLKRRCRELIITHTYTYSM